MISNFIVNKEKFDWITHGSKWRSTVDVTKNITTSTNNISYYTIAVVINKFDAKETKHGNKYSRWSISDLIHQDSNITLFLFSRAYQQHWKVSTVYIIPHHI